MGLVADVNGLSIAYQSVGQGQPLILLHGFLCDSRCWRTQLAGLSDQFRVVAWDAPGAGASSDPPDGFTITDWTHCLAGFLGAVGIERAFVLGLSWGGMLAQELYRLYPERVDRLILCDTYAGWRGSVPAEAAKRLERCVNDSSLSGEEFASRWAPEMFSKDASQELLDEMSAVFRDFHPHGFRLMATSLAETDTTDLLPEIKIPTLLLWGEEDVRSPKRIGEQFQSAIRGSELAVINNAGHVSNMEEPEEFNANVLRFCLS